MKNKAVMESVAPDIRPASTEDAAAIAALHVRGWQWAYRGLLPDSHLDSLSAELPRRIDWWRGMLAVESSPKRTWVAEINGQIVGFADTFPSWDEDADPATAMLGAMYLEQGFVRRGVGRALMKRLAGDLHSRGYCAVTLWVLDTNTSARRFYEALNWCEDGVTKTETRSDFVMRLVRYRLDLASTGSVSEAGRP